MNLAQTLKAAREKSPSLNGFGRVRSCVLVTLLFLSVLSASSAFALNSGITYHGRILQPDGVTPVAGVVQFKMQIRTPDSSNCLMYEEWQSIDLTGTNGVFAITINDGSGTRHDSSGLTIDTLFANRTALTFSPSACTGSNTYTPSVGDGRNLVVTFQSSTMTAEEAMPVQSLNFAPLAIEAKQVSGFQAANLLRFAKSDGTLVNTSPLNDVEYAALVALVDGTSTVYAKAGNATNGTPIYATSTGTIGSTTVGDMWLDTSTPGSDVLKINTDSGVKTIGLSSTGFITQITAGTGIAVSTSSGNATVGISAGGVGTTELATGAVTGTKIAAGTITGTNLDAGIIIATTGTVSASSIGTRALGLSNSLATPNSVTLTVPSGAFTNYGLTFPAGQGAPGQVLQLTDATTGQLSWVAQSAGSVTSVTAATTPGNPIVVIGGSTPTIDIGKADLTHNGYLASSDFSSFNSKASGSLASGNVYVGNASGIAAGVPFTGDVSLSNAGLTKVIGLQGVGIGTSAPTAAGQVLRYDGTSQYQSAFLSMADIRSTVAPGTTIFPATNCAASKALSWSSLTDAFTCQDIAISAAQVSGLGSAAYLNVGVGSNSVVQLDGSSRLPAVDGSQLTNLNASALASGTIPAARLPASASTWGVSGTSIFNANTGNVGIGTDAPAVALDVNGQISSNSSITAQTFTASISSSAVYAPASSSLTYPQGAKFGAANSNSSNGVFAGYAMTVLNSASNSQRAFLGAFSNSGAGAYTPSIVIGQQVTDTQSYIERLRIDPSGNVGIGTTAPAYKLDVAGAVNATAFSIAGVPISAGGASAWVVNGSNINNTNTGFVGIGTSTPMTALDVAGQIRAFAATGSAVIGQAASGYSGQFKSSLVGNTQPTLVVQQSGSSTADLSQWQDGSNNPLLVIKSSGNVGIGTTAPAYPLDVNGPARLGFTITAGLTTNALSNTVYTYSNYSPTGSAATPNASASFTYNSAALDGSAAAFISSAKNTAGNVQNSYFGTVSNASTYTPSVVIGQQTGATTYAERLRIDPGGNVGIGTTAPGYKLDVAGQVNATAFSIAGVPISSGGANAWAVNGSSIYNANTGNVGIGTDTPGATLDVAGAIRGSSSLSVGTTGSNGSVNLYQTGGGLGGSLTVNGAGETRLTNANGAGPITFWDAATELVRILPSGSVGIGTTAPGYKLDVAGQVNATAFSINGVPITSGGATAWAVNGTNIYNTNTGNVGVGTDVPAVPLHTVGTVAHMSGNVGIGTTAPASQLTITGGTIGSSANLVNLIGTSPALLTAEAGISSSITGSPTAAPSVLSTTAAISGSAYTASANANGFYQAIGVMGYGQYNNASGTIGQVAGLSGTALNLNNGTVTQANGAVLYAKNSGSGTMTTANAGNFSIANTGAGTIGTAVGVSIANASNSGGGTINTTYGLYAAQQTAGVNNYTIYSVGGTNYFGGNVGIGTSAPAYKLDVAGAVNATSLLINGVAVGAGGSSPWVVNGTSIYNTNTGSVGIGTTVPGYPLDVVGNIHTSSAFVAQGVIQTGAGSASNPAHTFQANATSGMFSPGSNLLALSTNSLERVRVDSTGNVGIGTTSPQAALDVNGSINSYGISLNGGNGTAYLASSNAAVAPNGNLIYANNYPGTPADGTLGGLRMSATNASSAIQRAYIGALSTAGGASVYTPSIVIGEQTGSLSYAERLRIDPNGNVGIGTTAPGYKLDVAGAINATSLLVNGVAVGAGGSSPWVVNGSNIFNTNTGYVGIGTSTPVGTLDLEGGTGTNTVFQGTSTGTNLMQQQTAGGANTILQNAAGSGFAALASGSLIGQWQDMAFNGTSFNVAAKMAMLADGTQTTSSAPGALAMYTTVSGATAPSERMRITSAGNVGIGTTAPSASLEVDGAMGGSFGSTFVVNPPVSTATSGTYNASTLSITAMPTAASTGMFTASFSSAVGEGTKLTGATVVGAQLQSEAYSGTVGTIIGAQNSVAALQSGTVTTAIAAQSQITSAVSSSVVNAYGYQIATPSILSAATITKNAAIAVNAQTGPTNNTYLLMGTTTIPTGSYGIYETTTNNNYIAGNVGIGTTAPATSLDITGAITERGMAAPAVAPTGQGRIYFDSSTNKFMVSQSTGAYVALGTGTSVAALGDLTDVYTSYTKYNMLLGSGHSTGYTAAATDNVSLGPSALPNLTSGSDNIGIGEGAGNGINAQSGNIAIGTNAMYGLNGSTASRNVAIGVSAMFSNSTGNGADNVAIGQNTLSQGVSSQTVALGSYAGQGSQGTNSVFVGYSAGGSANANSETVIGANAGSNLTGGENVIIGQGVMLTNAGNQTAAQNVIIGAASVSNNTLRTATNNVIVGYGSSPGLTSGTYNTLIGNSVGATLTTGTSNILIGNGTDVPTGATGNYLNIANTIYGNTSTGKIGIGTTAPAYKLDVAGQVNATALSINGVAVGGGDFKSDGSVVMTGSFKSSAGTAAVPGIRLGGATSTGFWYTGSGGIGMSVGGVEFMRVNTGGNVGIGTTVPGYPLDVVGDINTSTCIRTSAGVTGGTCTSDARLKEEIKPFDLGLDEVLKLQPRTFKYNGLGGQPKSKKPELGLIAQEVEVAAPTLVQSSMVTMHAGDKDKTEIKTVNYSAVPYMLINAIKDLYGKWSGDHATMQAIQPKVETAGRDIASLKAENAELKKETSELKQQNDAMKAYLCAKDPSAPICR